MLKSVTFRSTLAAVAWAISLSVYAMANGPAQLDIPAGNLVPALEALEKQAAIELVFQPQQLKSFHTRGVKGSYEPKDAVRLLLKGTPLEIRTDPSGAMVIVPPHTAVTRAQAQPQGAGDSGKADDSRSGLQLAQANAEQTSGSGSVGGQSSSAQEPTKKRVELEEVVVTAEKKTENLMDVPVPVTAISSEMLVGANQLRLEDYFTRVPGLNVTPTNVGEPQLTIRGLASGAGNPTVSILVDDVPYGSSSAIAVGGLVPDIDPSQLSRIEVLRGPQGTLYGASSIGGLIKYVTSDPSTDGVSGRLETGASSVYNGAELGYDFRGALNVPLSDTLALGASGFSRRDPGYIDDPGLHVNGVNETDVDGGRFAALWRPSQDFALKLSAMVQHTTLGGSPDVYIEPGLGDLQQSDLVPGVGGYSNSLQAYSATLTAKLGAMTLTSVSGYNINKESTSIDVSSVLTAPTEMQFGVAGSAQLESYETNKFTQEVRVSTPLGTRFDWLLGVFYTHERTYPNEDDAIAVNTNTGETAGYWFKDTGVATYAEYAAFTDLTLHATDRFDIQFGGRESENRQSYSEIDTGPWQTVIDGYASELFVLPEVATKDHSFTYLVTPTFRLSPDLMIYARFASGYRPGGPNPGCAVFDVPCSFKPDTTHNYEIGTKGSVLDHALTFDLSVYYIDWKDIQLSEYDQANFDGYTANAAAAKSQGVELSVETRPVSGLTISGWVAWNQAVLTEAFPANSQSYGAPGDRLPYSSRFSGNISLDEQFFIANGITGFAGGSVSYVGDRVGPFEGSGLDASARQDLPGYTRLDLQAGAKYRSYTVNLFLTNATDKRGILTGGLGTFPPNGFIYIQPRTVGISLATTF
jgi:iron complex outermembrane receptor protein